MSRPSLITRIRRFFAGRPRILAGGFATATLLASSLAFAQEPSAEPTGAAQVPTTQAPTGGAPAMDHAATPESTIAGPNQHPPAETAGADLEAAEHGGTPGEGEEGEHAGPGAEHKKHEHDHTIGMPEHFNFADLDRYKKQKDEVAAGTRESATTPYLYVLINALVLYAIYYYAGKKPIGDGLKARRDLVAKELDEAAKIKAEAKAKLDEYTDRLDKLDQELDRMKEELVLADEYLTQLGKLPAASALGTTAPTKGGVS